MDEQKEKKNKKVLIWIILILLLLIICLLVMILLKNNRPQIQQGGVTIDQNAGKYSESSGNEAGPQNRDVVIPGWSTLHLPAGTKEVDTVDFYNPDGNKDYFYLTFELRLPGENGEYETLYQSGLVEPGLHIQHIELSRELDAGSYDAVIHIQPYTMDENRTATNNADLKTTLVVE